MATLNVNRRQVSPSSTYRRRKKKKHGRLSRWKRAISNWLNGVPVRQADEFDSGSVRNEAITRERQVSNNNNNYKNDGKSKKSKNKYGDADRNSRDWFDSNNQSSTNLGLGKEKSLNSTLSSPITELSKDVIPKLKVFEGEEEIEGGEEDRNPIRVIQLPPEPLMNLLFTRKNDDVYSTMVSNEILTAKYTVLNFLPKNILEQMRRVANVYFVFIIILQCIPDISNYNPLLAASPVVIIMAVTAIKDAIEDWKRHQQDNGVNYSTCLTLHRPSCGPMIVRDTRYQRFNNFTWSIRDRFVLWLTQLYCKMRKRDFALEGRHRKLVKVLDGAIAWQETFWRDIRVGDIILLRNNEMIPADILLLSSFEPDGVCFVETKNLDGETNLKLKKSPNETSWIRTAEDAFNLKATIEAELPNNNLYMFNGKLILSKDYSFKGYDDLDDVNDGDGGEDGDADDNHVHHYNDNIQKPIDTHSMDDNGKYLAGGSSPMIVNIGDNKSETTKIFGQSRETLNFIEPTIIPIGSDGILLRGCFLRNTPYVIGVVAYTGPHTKLMLNSGGTPSKRTKIERQMNPQIILNFLLLFIICVSCAIVQTQFSSGYANAPYWAGSFQDGIFTSNTFLGFLTFFSSLILFQTLIPISMYVTLEMVKTVQAYFINNDVKMYSLETNRRAVPRAWNLADDLGQIEYLFSDKTGTLTQNVMEFRKCSIGGKVYGHMPTLTSQLDWDRMEGETVKELQSMLTYEYVPPCKFAFVDPALFADILNDPNQRERIFYFFLLLIVCHTVLIDQAEEEEELKGGKEKKELDENVEDCKGEKSVAPHLFYFKAQSPDEAALVTAARDLGFVFLGRDQNIIYVAVLGKIETITILHVLEFTSDRKRMSTIVKRANGEIVLMCKGADNVIFERLSTISASCETAKLAQAHLESFAEEGLRTLCTAHRVLDEDVYTEWLKRYNEACAAIVNRDLLTAALCDEIETNLSLLGATAIEDRLQDGVPECIELLQRAGIKIWVLTGDKMETAINIGFSCRLLTKRMALLVIRGKDIDETLVQLKNAYERTWSRYFNFGEDSAMFDSSTTFALIIEGSTLKFALDAKCRKFFLRLSTKCAAVICCRVSPLQKAKVVELVKRGKNAMTMAVGDGANDVSMIQAADIGVGIAGAEGMQAVMSSDYALVQFRFLERLLLIHGRWAYLRAAEVILCSLYKNVAFVVLLYWYQFYCGFTAQYIYDYMYLLFFNLFFSILPLLVLGFLERDLPAKRLLAVPQIFELGIRQSSFSMKLFLLYTLDALYQSIVCFFIPMLAYGDSTLTWSGYTESQTILGNIMALSIIITTNLYMSLNMLSWVIYSFVGVGVTILALLSFALFYSFIPSQPLFGSWRGYIDPIFWATLILSITVSLTPRIIIKYIQTIFYPTPLDIVREVEKYGIGEAELMRYCQAKEPIGGTTFPSDLAMFESAISVPPKAMVREYLFKKPLGSGIITFADNNVGEMENNDDDKHHFVYEKRSPPPQQQQQPSQSFQGQTTNTALSSEQKKPGLLKRSLALFNLGTNKFERLRGFAFSQEDGMGGIIEERRSSRLMTNHQRSLNNSTKTRPLSSTSSPLTTVQSPKIPTIPRAAVIRNGPRLSISLYNYNNRFEKDEESTKNK